MPGTKPKRLGVGSSAPGGPVTDEPGYWAYFELCKWETKIDLDIQSAYAISGDYWAGYETVESSRPKQRVKATIFESFLDQVFSALTLELSWNMFWITIWLGQCGGHSIWMIGTVEAVERDDTL